MSCMHVYSTGVLQESFEDEPTEAEVDMPSMFNEDLLFS